MSDGVLAQFIAGQSSGRRMHTRKRSKEGLGTLLPASQRLGEGFYGLLTRSWGKYTSCIRRATCANEGGTWKRLGEKKATQPARDPHGDDDGRSKVS